MKCIIFLFMQNKRFLFAIILVAFAFFQTAQAERITFATWNIRFANAEDSLAGNAWSVRVEKIAEMVHYFDFDILVVQVVGARHLNCLDEIGARDFGAFDDFEPMAFLRHGMEP